MSFLIYFIPLWPCFCCSSGLPACCLCERLSVVLFCYCVTLVSFSVRCCVIFSHPIEEVISVFKVCMWVSDECIFVRAVHIWVRDFVWLTGMWMLLAVRDRPFWLFLFQYELSLNSQRSRRFSLLYQPAVEMAIFIVRIFLNWENALTFWPIEVPDCIMKRWLWNNVHDLSAQQYQGRWFYKDIFHHPMSPRVTLCQSVLWLCKKIK